MLAQRWSNVDKITNQNPFYYSKSGCWPNVGAMLINQLNKPFVFLANLGVSTTRAQCWPDVVQPTFVICAILYVGPTLALHCKPNKIKGTDFQRYNGLPTLAQRSHAIWGNVNFW